MRNTLLVLAALALGGIGVVLYLKWAPVPVQVVVVQEGPAIFSVYASGTVESQQRAVLRNRIAGSVKEIRVKEGQLVKAGEFLATIDSTALRFDLERSQAELLAAQTRFSQKPALFGLQKKAAALQAQLKAAQADLNRIEILHNKGVATTEKLEQIRSQVDALQEEILSNKYQQIDAKIATETELQRQRASTEAAQTRAQDSELRAPFDGMIVSRKAKQGDILAANQEIMTLGTTHLWIEAWVPESDIRFVRIGMPASIRLNTYKQKSFRGHVAKILPDANRDQHPQSFEVDVELDEPLENISSGATCDLEIIVVQKAKAVLAPANAVSRKNNVWVVQEGRLARKKVKPGFHNTVPTDVNTLLDLEIEEGLSAGEHVVLPVPGTRLREGMRIKEVLAKPKQNSTDENEED